MDGGKAAQRASAGAHNKFTNAAPTVRYTVGILGGKAFVKVLVAGEYHIGAEIIERFP